MITELKQMAKNLEYLVFLDELAKRERNRRTTDLRRFRLQLAKQGHHVDRMRLREFFEELQKLGVGEIRETDTIEYFSWIYKQHDIGCAALGRSAAPLKKHYSVVAMNKKPKNMLRRKVVTARAVRIMREKAGLTTNETLELKPNFSTMPGITILLVRPGKSSIVKGLPTDLTKEEANQLADIIRSLPA